MLRNASPEKPRCSGRKPLAVLRFGFRGQYVDVALGAFGCPIAYLAGRPVALPHVLADPLTDEAVFSLPPAEVPDLFGATYPTAVATAARTGSRVHLLGEVVVPDSPSGRVILQNPPAGRGHLGSRIGVVIAVHRPPTCRLSDLAMEYQGGGPAAGSDSMIRIRNPGPRPCELTGPVALVGTDRAGLEITRTLTIPVDTDLVLTAHAHRVEPGHAGSSGEIVAAVMLAAEYRDDPSSPDGLCRRHQVIPTYWRLTLPGGVIRNVANTSTGVSDPGYSGLVTCRGRFNALAPIGMEP